MVILWFISNIQAIVLLKYGENVFWFLNAQQFMTEVNYKTYDLMSNFLFHILLTIVTFFHLPCTENVYADHQATSGQSQLV